MTLKNLMVHLDASERTALRLSIATELARSHKARLTGVFGQRAAPEMVGVVPTWPSKEYLETAAAVKAKFDQAVVGLPESEWIDVNRGGDAELIHQITYCTRFFDLAILGQYDERTSSLVPPNLAEEVVINAGRPILVIPYVGEFRTLAQHPLIAWNNSAEAAHALNDALPLIAGCQEAILLSLDAHREDAKTACAKAASHLACHGITAKTEAFVVEDIGVMDMLLNRATDLGADLLVMGAHAHIGFPHASRGAGTRHILAHMTLPVLMSS